MDNANTLLDDHATHLTLAAAEEAARKKAQTLANLAKGREKGRAVAKAKREAAKAAQQTSPPPPAPVATQPALAPPVVAGGRGLVPTGDEIGAMEYVYETLKSAQALPYNHPGPDGVVLTQPEAMALMLKGWELGTKPIDSMTGLFISNDGVIAQKAEYMRSRIQSSGVGMMTVVTLTDQKVVVKGIRYGVKGRADEALEVDYDVTRLQQAGGLTEAARRNLRGTLLSRATGQLGRALFSDVLAGACYTPEELDNVTQAGPVELPPPPPAIEQPAETPPVPVEAPIPAPPTETPTTQPPTPEPAPEPVTEPASKQRPLNVETFQAIGPNGVMQEVRTAGITKTILESILALAQRTPEAMARTKELLLAVGQTQLRSLTLAEGRGLYEALNAFVNPPPPPAKRAPEPPPVDTSIVQALRTFVDEFNAKHQADVNLDLVCRWVAGSYDVDDVGKLTIQQATQAMKEVRHAARDPQTLNILLGQAMGG